MTHWGPPPSPRTLILPVPHPGEESPPFSLRTPRGSRPVLTPPFPSPGLPNTPRATKRPVVSVAQPRTTAQQGFFRRAPSLAELPALSCQWPLAAGPSSTLCPAGQAP